MATLEPVAWGCTTWTGDFKCREVKTGFCQNRSMQTGSSGTLIGCKYGQTTFVLLWDRMEGAWLWTLRSQMQGGKTGFCRKREMQTGSSETLIGWKSESIATLPPFGPIEGQKRFDQISSEWESQKIRFVLIFFGNVPRAQKKKTNALQVPLARTQLALCLRLAIDLKGRKLATRRNPRWLANPNSGLTQYECGSMKPLLCPRHHRQVKLAVKT
jgi:hypothetical protein